VSVPQEDVDRLYDQVLAPRLQALETMRLDLKRYIVKAAVLVGVPFAMFFFGDLVTIVLGGVVGPIVSGAGFVLIFVGVIAAGLLYGLPGLTAMIDYRQRFKSEVVSEIFRIVCPTATYDPNEGLPESIFDEPGIFSTTGGFTSDDRVRGRIGHTPFEAAEVRRSYRTGGKNSRTVVVFHGLFFHIDFNKTVRGRTIVQPASAPGQQIGRRDGLSEVALESPDFTREFTVYTNDEVEARYILTPSMMEQLLSLRTQAGHPVFMAFTGNRAYLGIHYGRELFEPGIRTTTSKPSIEAMAREFALAETIVDELDLNTRIWTKGVDDSLLQRREDPAPPAGMDRIAKQAEAGTLTAAHLWDAATSAVGEGEVEGSEPSVQPAGSAIRIERAAGTMVITYGGRLTFLLSIATWLLCFPIAAAAFRATIEAWVTQTGADLLLDLGRRVPRIPWIDGWVTRVPLVWLVGASVIGGLSALDWTMRVRTVEIAPDEVRVRRGLRPWPRRYARPPYNTIANLGTSVYLKSDGFSLLTPTASPILTKDEADWVATEMRRALKETAHRRG
jgi:hypothetical protein